MKEVLDIVIPALFVLFMVFIFAGYHSTKRQQERDLEEQENEKKDS